MAGQPLATFNDFGHLTFFPGSVIQRPALVPYVLLVIERWSLAESTIFKIATSCLDSEPMVATVMLQAVDNQTAQRAAVLAGAKAVLKESEWLLFEAGFHTTTPSRNVRNAFVHHLWGLASEFPDALLLLDPKYENRDRAGRILRVRNRVKTGMPLVLAGENMIDPACVMVWRESDLKQEAANAERAYAVISRIWQLVEYLHLGRSTDSIRKWLLSDPLIQQKIHKTNPKT